VPFLKIRKKKQAPNTDHALALIIKDLKKLKTVVKTRTQDWKNLLNTDGRCSLESKNTANNGNHGGKPAAGNPYKELNLKEKIMMQNSNHYRPMISLWKRFYLVLFSLTEPITMRFSHYRQRTSITNLTVFIYSAIVTLVNKGTGVDELTVADQLNLMNKLEAAGGVAYLSHIISKCPTR